MASSTTVTFIGGMAMLGLTTFMPIHTQTAVNRSAMVAGLRLSAMLLTLLAEETLAEKLP